jgi:hypothetical protein
MKKWPQKPKPITIPHILVDALSPHFSTQVKQAAFTWDDMDSNMKTKQTKKCTCTIL